MITVDSNLLIYAYNLSTEQHDRAKRWWGLALNGTSAVRLAWSSIHAFLRVVTNSRIVDPALTSAEALTIVDEWLRRPNGAVLEPGPRYWQIFQQLVKDGGIRRDMIIDAHLAALSIEHNATLYTADADFRRFPGLRVVNPL